MIDYRTLFDKIAESLISDYVRIYLVNINSNEYFRCFVEQGSNSLKEECKGDDFFSYIAQGAGQELCDEDKCLFQNNNLKEKLLKQLRNDNHQSFVYRLSVKGKPSYHIMRLICEYVDGDDFFVIGVKNVDRMAREQMYVDKIAYIDTLTGAHNQNAYQELEENYQILIDKEEDLNFGLVVCDVNNLKIINDTMGHKSGDELLQSVFVLLRNTFLHSTIYRVGGDEFVVLLKDIDYVKRIELFNNIRETIYNNQNIGEGPVMAIGVSVYKKETDKKLSDVFAREDEIMYIDKERLKQHVARLNVNKVEYEGIYKIPAIKKARLDSFFKVFQVATDKGYIFFCDIRYDYSRWDKQVVVNYRLPSEYMYNAGGIWEKRIHPDDRENYHNRVEGAFNGDKEDFELSYRVQSINGNYNPCTCKAIVIRNQHGEPEYFGGVLFIQEGNIDINNSEDK